MGGAGSPGDNPLTDILVWGLHPFPEDIERLVLHLWNVSPRSLDKIDYSELADWKERRSLEAGRAHLNMLIAEYDAAYRSAFSQEGQKFE
jgi:hypothetical protein